MEIWRWLSQLWRECDLGESAVLILQAAGERGVRGLSGQRSMVDAREEGLSSGWLGPGVVCEGNRLRRAPLRVWWAMESVGKPRSPGREPCWELMTLILGKRKQ